MAPTQPPPQAVPNRPNVTSITLEIPDLFINLTTMNPNISFPSQPNTIYTSISTVIIRGKVLAQASLGCPAYCGDHGLCALGSDGRYGCVCECGWAADTNGSCTRPQGFCSQFGSGASGLDGSGNQTVVVRYYPAPPSPPAPPPAVCNCSASGGGRDGSSPASIPLSSTGAVVFPRLPRPPRRERSRQASGTTCAPCGCAEAQKVL